MDLLFKLLNADGQPANGGSGTWHLPRTSKRTGREMPGQWMPRLTGEVIACSRGYHLCALEDVLHWNGSHLYIAEGRGRSDADVLKIAFQQARTLSHVRAYNDTTLRLFAADCAEHVLPIFLKLRPDDDRPRLAIEAARAYARGEIGDAARDAAGDAARAAAGAAARAAAGAAARAVARAAARAAAGAAAGAAARAAAGAAAWDAAWAAAGDAAWEAEKVWQTQRLADMLGLSEIWTPRGPQ